MFHNSNVFGSCIIHILYTECAKIKKLLSSKCSLFHNCNVFGSCIIHILYTECAEFKKFCLQNAVCLIILTYLVPVLFTFYIQYVLKLKKNSSKCSLFHNSSVFCSCIIHILYTVCAKIKKISFQNAVCFIILTYLVPVLFTFYIQYVLKLKK